MLATVGNPQPSMRNGLNECLPIWNVVGAPTLWVYYGDDLSLAEKANARIYAEKLAGLINQDAAAPDLLAALKDIIATCNVRIDDPRCKYFDAARAAIAKAEGGAASDTA